MSNRQFYQRLGLGIFLALLGISGVNRPAISQEPLLVPPEGQPQPDNVQLAANNEQVEVLTRGPVHEAFAESVQLDPKSDLVVKKQPPQPIEEVPPDVKPAGDNIAWIPGYWSWDDTRNDFLWVSGVYRATPPNRTWVPGYFAQAETGWKWTPGFWAQAAAQHVEYLPQPPATLETGPTSDSPGADHYWVSGCWIHRGGHYAWRPGYWTVVNPNWIWIPDHYAWTPCGYVFVPGYWDYPMTYRGTIFAPVCFHQEVHLRPTFVYRPAVVLDVGVLSVHLWNRPHHCHYYFGDYYEATYVGLGYSPWFVSYTSYHGCYDPMFNYYRCVHHDEPRWSINIQVQHNFYREHHHHRPPATYVAQADYARRMQNDPHTESTIVPIGGRRGTKVGSAMLGA